MKGDFSRLTFDPKRHYSAVRMQQGRVQLDADWNEQVDISEHRIEKLFTDLIGQSGAPPGHFKIEVENDRVKIGEGRMYVAGLLCENDDICTLPDQPYLPGAELPEEDGHYLAYLDVWQRLVTVLEDSDLREPALGGPDTAARIQNVWQVKLNAVEGTNRNALETTLKNLRDHAISTGTLSARWDGFTPPENRLYRVEIHRGGAHGTATFKWSRDNGAMAARADPNSLIDANGDSTELREISIVLSQDGPATESWFAPNEYIELSNDALTLKGEQGILAKLSRVEGLTLTTEKTSGHFEKKAGENAIIRRWDSPGEIKVDAETDDGWIELEQGIKVRFGVGQYKAGDYWMIPSRRNDSRGTTFPIGGQRPKGVQHYYSPLALLSREDGNWKREKDLLAVFAPLTTGLMSKTGDTMTGPLSIDPENAAPPQRPEGSVLNVYGDVLVEGALAGATQICSYGEGKIHRRLVPGRILAGRAGPSTGHKWVWKDDEGATLTIQLPSSCRSVDRICRAAFSVAVEAVDEGGNIDLSMQAFCKWVISKDQLRLTANLPKKPNIDALNGEPGWHVSWQAIY